MTDLQRKVLSALTSLPLTRDSDVELCRHIWDEQLTYSLSLPTTIHLRAYKLLELLNTKKLYSYDSITRLRRKLQETNVHLRGKSWEAKHAKAKVIRNNINNLENEL